MRIAARVIVILVMFGSLLGSHPWTALAQPSVVECMDNPDLSGCPDDDGGENQTVNGSETEAPSGGSLVWNVIKLILALAFVVALIYALLKFFNKKNRLFQQNRTMENLGGLNLGPNKSVQAVRIGGRVFILGVGDSVQAITEITDEETIDALKKQDMSSGFKEVIKKNLHQGRSENKSSDFKQLFETQLKEMKEKRKRLLDRKEGGGGDE
ncbi:UNVERIFIED_CONTAM: flagellar biosynthetic protein FliO [Halobacillus marinus]